MDEKFDLKGRRAFVTGSSEGIGKAIVLALAAQGAEVFLHNRENVEKSKQAGQEIAPPGKFAGAVNGDLGNEKDVERIFAEVKHTDILVLNASVQIRKDFPEVTREEFDRQMHVNLWSGIRLIQLFHAGMKEKGWGRILLIGSVQQLKPHPQMPVYAAGKTGLTNLAVNLARQFGGDGITVNNLAPGVIETGRNTEALADPDYARQVRSRIPVGFFGAPEDCAGPALLLCSEAGRYITGQTIYCDGGMSL